MYGCVFAPGDGDDQIDQFTIAGGADKIDLSGHTAYFTAKLPPITRQSCHPPGGAQFRETHKIILRKEPSLEMPL